MRGSGTDGAQSVDVMAPALRRFWARASAQACVDERFRAALIADPVGVLRGEGADIPPGARLTIDGAPLAARSPAETGPVPVVQAAGVATASGSAGAMPSWGWGWGGGPCFAAGEAPQCAAAPPAGAAGSAGAACHWFGGCWGAACSAAAPVAPGSQGAVPPCACTFAWALTGGKRRSRGRRRWVAGWAVAPARQVARHRPPGRPARVRPGPMPPGASSQVRPLRPGARRCPHVRRRARPERLLSGLAAAGAPRAVRRLRLRRARRARCHRARARSPGPLRAAARPTPGRRRWAAGWAVAAPALLDRAARPARDRYRRCGAYVAAGAGAPARRPGRIPPTGARCR